MSQKPNVGTAIQNRWTAFMLGTVLGSALWLGFKVIEGVEEAWDSTTGLYFLLLGLCGVILAVAIPKHPVAGMAGLYFGQVLYMRVALSNAGIPIMPAAIAVLLFGLLPAVLFSLPVYIYRSKNRIEGN